MIDIETKRILNRFADIAERYVSVQESKLKPRDKEPEECEHKEDYLKAGVEHSWTRPDDTHKEPEECRHESDGKKYRHPEAYGLYRFLCKRCGEFYR